MHHYVYYSFEEYGKGYIGSRSCKCEPEKDTHYFGSFKDKTFLPTQKIILATYETREEALRAEMALHEFYEVQENPHFANRAKQTSIRFILCGEEAVNVGKKTKEMGVGIHALTKEELSKAGSIGGKISGKIGGKLAHELKLGCHGMTKEELSKAGSIGGKKTNCQKWQCTVTGKISSPGGLSSYQRTRNIDTSNRIRLQ